MAIVFIIVHVEVHVICVFPTYMCRKKREWGNWLKSQNQWIFQDWAGIYVVPMFMCYPYCHCSPYFHSNFGMVSLRYSSNPLHSRQWWNIWASVSEPHASQLRKWWIFSDICITPRTMFCMFWRCNLILLVRWFIIMGRAWASSKLLIYYFVMAHSRICHCRLFKPNAC